MEKMTKKEIKFAKVKLKTILCVGEANEGFRSCNRESNKTAEQKIRHPREKCWGLGVAADEQSCWLVIFWFIV